MALSEVCHALGGGRTHATYLGALFALALGACVEPLGEEGRSCPCTGVYACSDFNGMCVLRTQACDPPAAALMMQSDAMDPVCPPASSGPDLTLISNFENQSMNFSLGGQPVGWDEVDDKTGGCEHLDLAPINDRTCHNGGNYALRLIAAGMSTWGAGAGFPVPPGVDLPQYTGIELWARTGTSTFHVHAEVRQIGSPCGGDASADPCVIWKGDHVDMSPHWEKLTFPLVKMLPPDLAARPADAGGTGPAESAKYGFFWVIEPADQPGEWHQLDLWIDDVAWYH